MIARVGGVDRDDRQVRQILARRLRQPISRHPRRLVEHLFGKHVGDTELLDRDQREIARLERIAEPLDRSEEHTSELQSLMRISYAVFCLKKKKKTKKSELYS